MNLCTNASHAMDEEGGVLEVRLRNAEFGVWNCGRMIYIPHPDRILDHM